MNNLRDSSANSFFGDALATSDPEIAAALNNLSDQRTPTKRDWERFARSWGSLLDARISKLEF